VGETKSWYDAAQLADDLKVLGLREGHDVLLHSSMRQLGLVDGGPEAVLAAVRQVTGDVTIVVPTFTTVNSPTSRVFRAATERMTDDERLAFAKQLPVSAGYPWSIAETGWLSEHVRAHPEASRSGHPLVSFAAVGPRAREYMAVHDLDCHLGERSPLGALYRADASILLLGVGFDACSALHFAEYQLTRLPGKRSYSYFSIENGRQEQLTFEAIDLDDRDFGHVGADLDVQEFVRSGLVGSARTRTMPLRRTVDFTVGWMNDNRPWPWLDLK
jgi:aminoglycoside 3-N-acetyltransferase